MLSTTEPNNIFGLEMAVKITFFVQTCQFNKLSWTSCVVVLFRMFYNISWQKCVCMHFCYVSSFVCWYYDRSHQYCFITYFDLLQKIQKWCMRFLRYFNFVKLSEICCLGAFARIWYFVGWNNVWSTNSRIISSSFNIIILF